MYRVVQSEDAAKEGVGRVLPHIYGSIKGLLGIPLISPDQAALRTKFTIGDTFLELDSLQNLDDLPSHGIVQIDAERFQYNDKDRTNVRLIDITPGVDGTVPDDHEVGVAVVEALASHVFGWFENPQVRYSTEPRFYHSGIDAVYVNKLLKDPATDPTHTITNDDTAAVRDPILSESIHAGTVRFDMTDPVATDSPFANPASVAALQRQQQAQQQAAREFASQVPADPNVNSQATTTAPPGTHVVTFIAADDPAPISGRVFPFLGAVTADVTGLIDADGSIVGTADRPIVNAAHVARAMLRFGFSVADVYFDNPSWELAASRVATFGWQWVAQFLPMSFGQFQDLVYSQSRINVWYENGLFRAKFRERGDPVMTLVAEKMVSFELDWTDAGEIVAELHVTYGASALQQATIIRTSADASRTPGSGEDVRPGQTADITMPWVVNPTMAEDLTTWILRTRDHQRHQATIVYHSDAWQLLRFDTVQIDQRILEPYGGLDLLWKVDAVRMRPDGFVELLVEEDDSEEAIFAAFLAASSGSSSVSGIGSSIAASVGSAAGAATVSGIGRLVLITVGASAGASTAAAISTTVGEAVGSSAGVATPSGIGEAIWQIVGSSAGTATVAGDAGDTSDGAALLTMGGY